MKVKGFDGREHTWPPTGKVVSGIDRRQRSSLHLRCRTLLKTMYPSDMILEEVPLPGSEKLSADFYLPSRNMVIEVHGEQHYKFVAHFHGNVVNFLQSKQRDLKKIDWCNENNIAVIELPYNEADNEWRNRINKGTESRRESVDDVDDNVG